MSYLLLGMKAWIPGTVQGSDLSENGQEQVGTFQSWGAAGSLEKNQGRGRGQARTAPATAMGYAGGKVKKTCA